MLKSDREIKEEAEAWKKVKGEHVGSTVIDDFLIVLEEVDPPSPASEQMKSSSHQESSNRGEAEEDVVTSSMAPVHKAATALFTGENEELQQCIERFIDENREKFADLPQEVIELETDRLR